jgi:hypothetical protein
MARVLQQINLDALQNVEPARRRELWERLPGEPERAFQAFAIFRDAAERRVVSEVGAKLTPPCSRQNVWRWSFRWRWEERAASFDVDRDRRHRDEMARARTEMDKRHLKIGMAMQSIGAHALAELQQRVEMKLPLNLSADEARGFLEAGAKMERSVHGPGRESKYSVINVILGDAEPIPEPAEARPALCDDTTDEIVEGDAERNPN